MQQNSNKKGYGRTVEIEKQNTLHDWIADGGYGYQEGYSGISCYDQFPQELSSSIAHDFNSFSLKMLPPRLVQDIVMRTFLTLDHNDPYNQFCYELGGVKVSNDSYHKTYNIKNSIDGRLYYVEPEFVESFQLVDLNKDVVMFNILASHPGVRASAHALDAHYAFESILECVFASNCYSDHNVLATYLCSENYPSLTFDKDSVDEMSEYLGLEGNLAQRKKHLGRICQDIDDMHHHMPVYNPNAEERLKEKKDYQEKTSHVLPESRLVFSSIDLVVWSFLKWYYGPTQSARDTRMFHPIYENCYRFGECIAYDYGFFSPESYVVTHSHPNGCADCGVVAWCVQLCQIENASINQCEACVNGSAPLFNGVDCGSKVCRYIECPNHYLHGTQHALLNAYRAGGMLNKKHGDNIAIQHEAFKQLA